MSSKAKNITIRIRSLDQGLDNFVEAAEALLKSEIVKKQQRVYFENLDSFRKRGKLFTENHNKHRFEPPSFSGGLCLFINCPHNYSLFL